MGVETRYECRRGMDSCDVVEKRQRCTAQTCHNGKREAPIVEKRQRCTAQTCHNGKIDVVEKRQRCTAQTCHNGKRAEDEDMVVIETLQHCHRGICTRAAIRMPMGH